MDENEDQIIEIPPVPTQTIKNPNSSAVDKMVEVLIDPEAFLARMRKSWLGDCEFRYDEASNKIILGEWIKVLSDRKDEDKRIWVSPPMNPPLVRNPKLLKALEAHFYALITAQKALSKPEQPEMMAKMMAWSFCKFMQRNWKEFELDPSLYHTLWESYAYATYDVLKGAEGDANRKWTASFTTISEQRLIQQEQKKKGLLEGVLDR